MDIIKVLRKNQINNLEDSYKLFKKNRNLVKHNKNITVQSIFGISNNINLRNLFNPKIRHNSTYVLLDTNNIDTTLSTDVNFTWKIINSTILEQGSISIANDVRDLIGMRIFPVKMQTIAPITETGKTYITPMLNLNYNFNILIHEFQAQSFIARDGKKFHFSLFPSFFHPILNRDDLYKRPDIISAAPNYTFPYVELATKSKLDGYFWFREPITEFSTITISITNPFDLVQYSQIERTLIPLELIFLSEVM